MKQKFNWKSFVSFSLGWSFFIILISGIVLYIAPPGRIANWTYWTLFGFSKSAWQALHTIFSYTFVILSIFHLFSLNWKAFWSYFVTKTSKGLNRKKELIISVVLVLVVFAGTYFNIQPFKAVIDFGEWTTESWEKQDEQPPIPHAELLTIKELSGKYVPLSADSILLLIREKGFKADSIGQSIAVISELNNMTPSKFYSIIIPESGNQVLKIESKPQIQGAGRKTILVISNELGKGANEVIEILAKSGIKANPEDKIKAIAESAGKTPMEIMELINNRIK